MKTILIMSMILAGSVALAEVSYVSNGKTLAPSDALLAASKGQAVSKCQPVEMKASKSGTSFSLRNIKSAPKTAKK